MVMTETAVQRTPQLAADETEQWEYTYIEVKMGHLEREMLTINSAGSEGWEMVSAFPIALGGWHDPACTTAAVFMFKRRRRR